jgi:hypothetical protein
VWWEKLGPPLAELELPPWKSRSEADVKKMTDWVTEHLRAWFIEDKNRLARELAASGRVEFDISPPGGNPFEVRANVERTYEECIAEARKATEADDAPLEPLREYLRKEGRPELTEFIKSNRPRHIGRHPPDYVVERAKENVKMVRQLWFQMYGKERRSTKMASRLA